MTPQEPAITTAPQYRFAGWAAITSGMIGFFAYAALMTGGSRGYPGARSGSGRFFSDPMMREPFSKPSS